MLDEDAFADALRDDPDETLTLLAELVGATDEQLREHARRLAGRIVVDLVRRGTPQRRGIGRLRTVAADAGGELDLERSLDTIAVSRGTGHAPPLDELSARDWSRPDLAICLLVDRSGSMGGTRLATAAMAGFSYKVNDFLKTDIGYRWLHLQGSTFSFGSGVGEKLFIPTQNIHEIRVGVRYDIN